IQFISPIQRFLQSFTLYSDLPAFHTNSGLIHLAVREIAAERVGNLHLFIHPGVVLFYACFLTYVFYWLKKEIPSRSSWIIFQDAARRLLPTTLCVWSMVTVAVIMENCGMTSIIASTMSQFAFNHYPLIAPWIGAIGAFLTGSNTNSNILFGLLQSHTAQLLHIPVYLILAGQTAGASLGSVLAPAKIIVGTSTTGLIGNEGLVLKKLLPFVILEVLLISMILYWYV
ncbi:MAG: L-lactate permease, partial [Candidatus Kryptoniota bacterium]